MNVFLLMVALMSPVEAPGAGLQEATAVTAAVAAESVVPEAAVISAAKPAECPISETATAKASVPPAKVALPAAKSAASCTIAELYTKKRFLSGPWSAARRLEAARRRGDANESRRMESLLGELIIKALEVEGTEP